MRCLAAEALNLPERLDGLLTCMDHYHTQARAPFSFFWLALILVVDMIALRAMRACFVGLVFCKGKCRTVENLSGEIQALLGYLCIVVQESSGDNSGACGE
jgi:hypothetical protein